ncbi:MAG: hypothetical protein O7C65_00145 [Planctomycetota bacterium]|nr:hypothetical protein [Planctomycetota bacterium]
MAGPPLVVCQRIAPRRDGRIVTGGDRQRPAQRSLDQLDEAWNIAARFARQENVDVILGHDDDMQFEAAQ